MGPPGPNIEVWEHRLTLISVIRRCYLLAKVREMFPKEILKVCLCAGGTADSGWEFRVRDEAEE